MQTTKARIKLLARLVFQPGNVGHVTQGKFASRSFVFAHYYIADNRSAMLRCCMLKAIVSLATNVILIVSADKLFTRNLYNYGTVACRALGNFEGLQVRHICLLRTAFSCAIFLFIYSHFKKQRKGLPFKNIEMFNKKLCATLKECYSPNNVLY